MQQVCYDSYGSPTAHRSTLPRYNTRVTGSIWTALPRILLLRSLTSNILQFASLLLLIEVDGEVVSFAAKDKCNSRK
ncbi:hypothetical protein PISMIDRAFT_198846 [Pisolithus microcarpus 441]|uniref:Uncharacterized protein n=1 Tax=Pisolithus microcarpus 441 TaxID=765257 RepID=A0A0C9ZDS5_9AGAM|nr:hypothetical protein PISMIDRAFT_198846 [Pisolithus microcarpus 441]